MKKFLRCFFVVCAALAVLAAVVLLVPNIIMITSTDKYIVNREEADGLPDGFDCILVLGAGVYSDGTPTPMLNDRLVVACEAYELGLSNRIIMSGDHMSDDYNEPGAMKRFAIAQGVNSDDIFLDHAGLSTYDSVYRAINVFGAKKILIVTQEYHLHRAIYLAQSLGAEAYGVSANLRGYKKQPLYSAREWAARVKDMGFSILKPDISSADEKIDLLGNGDLTN